MDRDSVYELTPDQIECELVRIEALIGRLRGLQARLVERAAELKVPRMDGSRSIVDRACARLDIAREKALDLARVARHQGVDTGSGSSTQPTTAWLRAGRAALDVHLITLSPDRSTWKGRRADLHGQFAPPIFEGEVDRRSTPWPGRRRGWHARRRGRPCVRRTRAGG